MARRTAEGKTRKEIMRCRKRFVAREVFHALTALAAGLGRPPIHLSGLERGLAHNSALANQAKKWLQETP